MPEIKKIGLIANPDKPRWQANLTQAVSLIEAGQREAVAPQLNTEAPPETTYDFDDYVHLVKKTDLILVVGGDGTMLGAARALQGAKTPILGINTGNLGFLTTAPMADLEAVLSCIWEEDFRIVTRPFIEATIKNRPLKKAITALNDFVISRGELSRMIQLNVSVDGDFLTKYQADGLIVCSPTGSTAYSLSAGGPIVSPNTAAISLTPICPHALSNRSVIVPLESVIEVEVGRHRHETILTADGQVPTMLKPRDTVQFRRSKKHFRLLSLRNNSFFKTLRQKMKWSGSNL